MVPLMWSQCFQSVRSAGTACLKVLQRMQLEDCKQFRQWGSQTPGHPENFETLGIEVTTGWSI